MVTDDPVVTVITGAASGIGFASAERLAARGDRVVMVDQAADRLEAAAGQVAATGASPYSRVLDVRDRPALEQLCIDIRSTLGPITYLFSNAGGGRPCRAVDLSLTEWQEVIDTHVTGAYNVCRAALPYMSNGAILFTSSDFAIVGYVGYAHYCAAKAALYSLAKSLAIELAPAIRVNALGPGPIDTPHLHGAAGSDWDEARTKFEGEVPMRRLGSPDEVASVADFLLSDRAAYITGQIVQPNGGQVMW